MISLLVGLAMQIILEAQKPDISLDRKIEALKFAQTVISYASAHPEIDSFGQVATISPMVKPVEDRVKVLEDKQAVIAAKATADAEKARVKAERVAPLKAQLADIENKIAINEKASADNQHRIIELGTGITSGEMGIINREDVRLKTEYESLNAQRANLYQEIPRVERE